MWLAIKNGLTKGSEKEQQPMSKKLLHKEKLLTFNNVSKSYNDHLIIDKLSFVIKQGEIVTILGPNGGGKSSLAKLVVNIIKPTKGKIWRKKNIRIGYVPQKIKINDNIPLTVKYFLMLTQQIKLDHHQIITMAQEVGISEILDHSIHNISGGEMQRLIIARALISQPDILVLDEPEQNLDAKGRKEIYTLLQNLNSIKNLAILMISHDLHLVMKKTSHVIFLDKKICCEGKPEKLIDNKAYKELYGENAANILSFFPHYHKDGEK